MKNFCKTHTLVFILAIILIALASNLVPGFIQRLLDSNLAFSYIINSICKCAFSAIPLTLMVKWGYTSRIDKQQLTKGFFIGSIFILFCIPNILPLILLEPIYFSVQWDVILAVALAAFSIGLLEETAIRGVLFPFFCEKWKEKKHGMIKAALISSFLFGAIHLNWSVRCLLMTGTLPLENFMGNLYQVYYTFCFGILAAGVAVYAKSIWPVVFWHGICDFGAFIVNGLIPQVSLNYFCEKNILSLQNVLNTYNILQRFKYGEELIHGCINLIFVIVGILLIRKAEKVQI